MAQNVNMDSLRTIYVYDPAASGTDFSALRTITGTPSISSSQLRLTSATVQTRDAALYGRLTTNMTIQTAPTAGQSRIWGYYSQGYPNLGSSYFEVSGTTFRVVTKDDNGTAETTNVAWSSGYTNTATEFRIDWLGEKVTFYINDVAVATHATRVGQLPQSITIKNGVADNWDTAYVVVTSISKITGGSSGGDLSEFPAPAAMADNIAVPTTTEVGAILQGYDGTNLDLVRVGQTANGTSVTGYLNTLPGARYNATPTARTEAQFGNLQADANGNLQTNNATLLAGEDQTNTVFQTVLKPLAVSTYTLTRDSSSALEASSVSKAGAGNLYRSFGVIDKSAPTGMYYVLHLDAASLPADGAVTHLITPIPINHTSGTDSTFDTGMFEFGVAAANGIVIVLSTTMVTKTISGSYLFATTLTK